MSNFRCSICTQRLDRHDNNRCIAPGYEVRFIRPDQSNELVNLYHLARVPLNGSKDTPYERMLWASREFAKLHPEVTSTAVYKDICGILDR